MSTESKSDPYMEHLCDFESLKIRMGNQYFFIHTFRKAKQALVKGITDREFVPSEGQQRKYWDVSNNGFSHRQC